MALDNTKRMAALQAKGAGAPPQEPPMAPPDMQEPPPEEPQGPGGDMGGMPPPDQVVPQIATVLEKMAAGLPDEQKNLVMSAVQQLQTAFPTDPSKSGGMSADDSEAYGEQPAV